jgi:peroxiredoxin
LADYREQHQAIREAGASLVAVSVDAPEKSEAVRRQLRLPFPILSDRERRVVQEWDIYNPNEKGGIAKPAVFILAPDRSVRFVSVDGVSARVPAAEIVKMLQGQKDTMPTRRKHLIPNLATFLRAIRNALHLGARQPRAHEQQSP